MLEEMSFEEYDDWFEHYQKEPWGYELESHQHSELCVALYNGLLPKKEGHYSMSDFKLGADNPENQTEETEKNEDEDTDYRIMKSILVARFGKGEENGEG